ncbi:MAG: PTS sugar transporter subunit IIC [Clostridiales bacterium]|nr:PTS sugar transporter subunit IIC [Clostridiales bacterium]
MALGLFCTLIIGTIIGEIGYLIGKNWFGNLLYYIGTVAKMIMGAGIGVGIAHSLKANKLTSFSAAVAGMVGANITNIFALSGIQIYGASANPTIGIGDPVGAFVASVTAIEVTRHVEGKTPIDIIVVPLCAIVTGTLGAIALGIPFGILFALLGKAVSLAIGWEPVSFGILVAVIMGLLLTLPTSSAAFGVMIFSSSLINTPELTANAQIGAAAACAGCCAHMVGFAVASFRENRWAGLVSQGIGTSMLQIPNLGKNPRILVPAVVASAVAGPLASAAFGIMCDATGAGMGTAGLVGVINTFITSLENGMAWWYVLIAVLVCYIIVPAAVALGVSELMRKKKWIKLGDMKI